MDIFFYAPFKPLDHESPSGDLVTARGLVEDLSRRGHRVRLVSTFRSRWVFWKPWLWPTALNELRKVSEAVKSEKPDLWLTYHTYYKAPDLFGPRVAARTGIPYVIFQGMYSSKTRRSPKTWPGYFLNLQALVKAHRILSNRKDDFINLKRVVPADKITYVTPGIDPDGFVYDPRAREEVRKEWQVGEGPVIAAAAMFRSDVKTKGLLWLIEVCGRLLDRGVDHYLAIAGDGPERGRIETAARRRLGDRVRMPGMIPRDRLFGFYSAADVFAFPGFRESLGMVYLEAQACSLPVVALDNGGIPEVVQRDVTGFLPPHASQEAYARDLERLLADPELRRRMGRAAEQYVREVHDVKKNYIVLESVLVQAAGDSLSKGA